jgi:DNA-binding response OmpR family regulator
MPLQNPALKHAVLRVRFASAAADCADANSQPVAPGEALVRLREGDAWAALLSSGHDVRELTDWLMLLRHQPGGRLPGVLALLPDVAGPGALAALRAGACAVLQHDSTAALIRAQLMRLRERVAPQPDGWLQLDGDLALDGAARHLRQGGYALSLPPQLFHLLWTLAARAGHVLGPQALRLAMDIPARAHADTVHTAVGRLRRALRPLGLERRLQTVHGVGYRWLESAADADAIGPDATRRLATAPHARVPRATSAAQAEPQAADAEVFQTGSVTPSATFRHS